MIILGLVILVAAVVIAVAGVLSNSGSAHEFTGGFSVFGVDVTGSTGTLFLYGIVVGAAALLGLSRPLPARRAHEDRARGGHGCCAVAIHVTLPASEPAADLVIRSMHRNLSHERLSACCSLDGLLRHRGADWIQMRDDQ
jgi:hypothetical protein